MHYALTIWKVNVFQKDLDCTNFPMGRPGHTPYLVWDLNPVTWKPILTPIIQPHTSITCLVPVSHAASVLHGLY